MDIFDLLDRLFRIDLGSLKKQRKKRGQEDQAPQGSPKKPKRNIFSKFSKWKWFIVGVPLALFLLFNSFYTLGENATALITTFGVPSVVSDAGPHFKIPFIQNVIYISKNIAGMTVGYDTSQGGEDDPQSVISDSEMITKDLNFVNVDFYIEYQVVDPVKYYINKETAEDILRNLAKSYIRDTVGLYNVDDVITTGKGEIQAKVKEQLSERLEEEDIGLGIYNVTIQDAEPPTAAVNDAFKKVEDAKQSMDTAVNNAKQYQSEQIPSANAKADKEKQDALAYKQQRISEAEGQVARFNEMYEEYRNYPLITKKRMFYEAIEDILPGLKVIIDSSDGTQKVLPLEPFTTGTADGGQ